MFFLPQIPGFPLAVLTPSAPVFYEVTRMVYDEHFSCSRSSSAASVADASSAAIAAADVPASIADAGVVGGPGTANPSALTVEQLARLFAASGSKFVTVEVIRRHIEAGAPVAADGRVNLVHYVAWVAREVANADDEK